MNRAEAAEVAKRRRICRMLVAHGLASPGDGGLYLMGSTRAGLPAKGETRSPTPESERFPSPVRDGNTVEPAAQPGASPT